MKFTINFWRWIFERKIKNCTSNDSLSKWIECSIYLQLCRLLMNSVLSLLLSSFITISFTCANICINRRQQVEIEILYLLTIDNYFAHRVYFFILYFYISYVLSLMYQKRDIYEEGHRITSYRRKINYLHYITLFLYDIITTNLQHNISD